MKIPDRMPLSIIMKLKNDNVSSVYELTKKGFDARITKCDEIIIKLNYIKFGSDIIYLIPQELSEGRLFISCWEEGGVQTYNQGKAIIACKTDGQPLIPFFIPDTEGIHGYQAKFCAQFYVEIYAHRQDAKVEIIINNVKFKIDGTTATIIKSLIWQGASDKLPEQFRLFETAVKAAVAKTYDSRKQKPFYVWTKNTKRLNSTEFIKNVNHNIPFKESDFTEVSKKVKEVNRKIEAERQLKINEQTRGDQTNQDFRLGYL